MAEGFPRLRKFQNVGEDVIKCFYYLFTCAPPWHACEGQTTTCGDLFPLGTHRALGEGCDEQPSCAGN